MPLAKVRKLSDKGYGFLDVNGRDVFFHATNVVNPKFDELHEGDTVEYEIEEAGSSGQGPRAVQLQKCEA